jgi:type I restriction enzyme S subunit
MDRNFIVGHLDGNHGALYPRSHEFVEYGVPYITANELTGYKVEFSTCKYLTEERARRFRKGVAKDRDVLFAHNATVGPTALLSTQLEYVILSTTATYYRCNPNKLKNTFLLYALQSEHFARQYRAIMAQSTRNQVPITAQRKLFLVLPPTFAEQGAIAAALSDADALIEALEQLLAKKRQVKQGAMQELLTGKKRLPGFDEDWSIRQLQQVVNQFIVPMRDKPKKFRGEIPWCRIEDFDGKYLSSSKSGQFVDDEIVRDMNLRVHPTGTLLVSCSADLGRCAIVGKPLVSNQTFIGLVFDDIKASNEFFYYYMTFHAQELNNLSTGTTIGYLSREQFEAFKVKVPSTRKEQTAIAEILSDMDAEIAALEAKLAKARQVKQGMMQELLTGRIRLV